MNCQRCQAQVDESELREHHGHRVCEDCYMDLLSPTRMCDPWAVRSAKSTLELKDGDNLNDLQQGILEILQQCEGISLRDLAVRLKTSERQLEKEVAALRHMEKVRAAMQNGRKVLVLW